MILLPGQCHWLELASLTGYKSQCYGSSVSIEPRFQQTRYASTKNILQFVKSVALIQEDEKHVTHHPEMVLKLRACPELMLQFLLCREILV